MYTKDDYTKDLYIKEHGSGMAQTEAALRCMLYERGRNPEYDLSDSTTNREEFDGRKKVKFILGMAVIFGINALVIWFIIELLSRMFPNW